MTRPTMPNNEPPLSTDRINVSNVDGDVNLKVDGDFVGGSKIVNYNYAPVELRTPLRHGFDLLIKRLTHVFAGRKQELARIVEFISSGGGGYLIVTAPAGFGKSALMASLI